MNYPIVTERKVRLEAVAHDPFIDKLPPPSAPSAPVTPPPPPRA